MKEDEVLKKIALSIKKASGTLTKVESMIDRQDACVAVVQQMDAAIGLIQAARKHLVGKRLEECFRKNAGTKNHADFLEVLRLYEITRK